MPVSLSKILIFIEFLLEIQSLFLKFFNSIEGFKLSFFIKYVPRDLVL